MIRRFNKHEPVRQLDLFAPRAPAPLRVVPPPAPPPVVADRRALVLAPSGWFELVEPPEKPTSRATGGCLNAVEAWRAICGYSLELAGLLSESGAYCSTCMRFLFHNPSSKPLYEAARAGARVRGEEFECARCATKFSAHRYERA